VPSRDFHAGSANPAADTASVSIIIPAYNAASTLARCLDSVFRQAGPDVEVIVVDDRSSDATQEVASGYPVRLIALAQHGGSGVARNRGAAAAQGQVLLFTDADVTLGEGALSRVRADLAEPGVDAVIGSYDDDPAVRTTISQFKNLAHHYFHQRSGPEVTTFWGACGIIGRELFLSMGGFDEELPEMSDVDLGYRLAARGAHIRLDPALQVKHLKQWTLKLLLKTDLNLRAFPWAILLLKYGYLPRGLNFTADQRAAGILAMLLAVLGAASLVRPAAAIALVPCAVLAAWVNRDLYRLFYRRGGLRLLAGGFLLQQLYYLYSAVGLIAGIARTLLARR